MSNGEYLKGILFGKEWPHKVQPGRLTKSELSKQLDSANEGIWRYDEHLFRIRSWWMAISALLIVGFLSDSLPTPSGSIGLANKSAEFGFFVITIIGIGFWSLDALNKSLQLVLIHMARDIEQAMFFDIPVWTPSKSRRYQMRDGRHLRNIVKNMSEQSVFPFYAFPIIGAAAILYIDHLSNNKISTIHYQNITTAGSLALILSIGTTTLLLMSSIYIKNRYFFLGKFLRIGYPKYKKRHVLKLLIKEKIVRLERIQRLRGFQFHFTDERSAIFLDYSKTWKHESFILERDMVCEYLGIHAFLFNVETNELFDCSTGEASSFGNASTEEVIEALKGKLPWRSA